MASAGDNFKDIIAAANHRAATDADTADSNLAPAVVKGTAAITSNEIHFWKVKYFALNELVTIKSVLILLFSIVITGTQIYSIEFFIRYSCSFRNLDK